MATCTNAMHQAGEPISGSHDGCTFLGCFHVAERGVTVVNSLFHGYDWTCPDCGRSHPSGHPINPLTRRPGEAVFRLAARPLPAVSPEEPS